MSQEKPLGRFCWHELLTSDPEAAQPFYQDIIEWGTMVWDGGKEPYTMWTNGETPLGGLMQLPEEAAAQGAPPHWLPHLSSPDVDATVAKAAGLEAQVLRPVEDIPMVGRFAILADPQGAVVCVFEAANETPGHDGLPQLREFSWHELMTSDPQAAYKYYQEVFGWDDAGSFDMGEMGTYLMFGRGEVPLGGMFVTPPDVEAPPHWGSYIMVEDVDSLVETIKEKGGQIVNGPMEVPGGDRIAQCLDPQGAYFAIHSRKPE